MLSDKMISKMSNGDLGVYLDEMRQKKKERRNARRRFALTIITEQARFEIYFAKNAILR